MGRTIDENSVIDIVTYECGEWSGLAKEIEKQIRALPPAERKGHWINRNGDNIYPFWERYKCSVCGGNSNNSDYCPSCGARMEREE